MSYAEYLIEEKMRLQTKLDEFDGITNDNFLSGIMNLWAGKPKTVAFFVLISAAIAYVLFWLFMGYQAKGYYLVAILAGQAILIMFAVWLKYRYPTSSESE